MPPYSKAMKQQTCDAPHVAGREYHDEAQFNELQAVLVKRAYL